MSATSISLRHSLLLALREKVQDEGSCGVRIARNDISAICVVRQ